MTYSIVLSGKENGENILKSIDEGPFKMGKFKETLAQGAEGALHLGPQQDRVFTDLSPEEKERVVVHNIQGRQNRGHGNYVRGAVTAGNGGVQNRGGNANPGGKTNTFDDDVDEAPVQDLAFNKDNVFQADQCDAFDSDVDEAPTTQTMFMANLSSADPIYDEAAPSYDLDILSQSALYNGHEIVKTNHAPDVVHDSEDTLELAEITRKRMLEKVKSPSCVEKKVKIVPPDYSKENYLATFTPQRHLTPEQIF
ncbi:hypothetical protein Tco_1501643 [Tanacetum coccineum]